MNRTIYGTGEIVLDIIFKNDEVRAAKAGGSILNTMVSLGRAGANVCFISELGKDRVGGMIIDFLEKNGIYTNYIQQYESCKSAIALAFLNEKNDASYSFYKDYPVARELAEVPLMTAEDVFMFGSFYGIDKNVRSRVIGLANTAKDAGALIYYDPNFRKAHLHELDDLKPLILENFTYADIIHGSNEDFEFILHTSTAEDSYKMLSSGSPVLVYTENSKGVKLCTPGFIKHYDVPAIKPVSTIGAGDNFNAGMMFGIYKKGICKKDLPAVSENTWDEIIGYAIAFATDVCLSYDNYISTEFANNLKK